MRRADYHFRLRGNDGTTASPVIPAKPVPAKTGIGNPLNLGAQCRVNELTDYVCRTIGSTGSMEATD